MATFLSDRHLLATELRWTNIKVNFQAGLDVDHRRHHFLFAEQESYDKS